MSDFTRNIETLYQLRHLIGARAWSATVNAFDVTLAGYERQGAGDLARMLHLVPDDKMNERDERYPEQTWYLGFDNEVLVRLCVDDSSPEEEDDGD